MRWEARMDRRGALRTLAGGVALLAVGPGELLATERKYVRNAWSPQNRRREERDQTSFITLHNTDGPFRASYRKLRRNGECNYLVRRGDGLVYRMINHARVSYHVGESLWDGFRETRGPDVPRPLSSRSISIEFDGWADQDLSEAEYRAARWLIPELQELYGVDDPDVVTHGMLAVEEVDGALHRGRKLCGMLLNNEEARARMGLGPGRRVDPDVASGRVVPDDRLSRALYASSTVAEAFENGPVDVLGVHDLPWDVVGGLWDSPRMLYALPDGRRRTGDRLMELPPPGTVVRRYW